MQYGSLVFGKEDFVMIKHFQEMNATLEDYVHKNTLDILEKNMSKAMVFESDDIPSDIVQIYSNVTVTCGSGWSETFQLVPPYEVDIENDKISVIGALGASIIGLSEGDSLRYGLPGNIMTLKIKSVGQKVEKVKMDIPDALFKKNCREIISIL
tara:strand:+ start:8941 stop:9402 length:462 start_codon:yes stop_codon:yes gene_type:complete